jgi:hypothetical protein
MAESFLIKARCTNTIPKNCLCVVTNVIFLYIILFLCTASDQHFLIAVGISYAEYNINILT